MARCKHKVTEFVNGAWVTITCPKCAPTSRRGRKADRKARMPSGGSRYEKTPGGGRHPRAASGSSPQEVGRPSERLELWIVGSDTSLGGTSRSRSFTNS